MVGFNKTTELYGQNNYVSFSQEESQERYLAERFEGYVTLQFGQINGGEKKEIDLAAKELTFPLSIKSVYAFSSQTTNDEIRFRIFYRDDNNRLIQVANQRFSNADMPYRFPDGAILLPNQIVEVEPRYSVINIIAYCKPADIIFNLEA